MLKVKEAARRMLRKPDIFELFAQNPKLRLKVDEQYTYQENLIDIPYDVAVGERNVEQWRAEACKKQQEIYDRVPLSRPLSFGFVKEYENEYGKMTEYRLVWDAKDPLQGSEVGGTIAIPKKHDTGKPLIIFIHGHGMVKGFSGVNRRDLFDVDNLANEPLRRGHVVWAPDNVFHDELMPLFEEHDFSDMWAKVINQTWDMLVGVLPKTRKRYVIGLAGGGTTGLSMFLANREMDGLVAAGVFFPLDLTRRDYRIKNHPFCFDFRHYASYLPLYAMALGRPLQVQMGKHDGLWAGNENLPSEGYSGLKRSVLTEESLGPLLILDKLSRASGAKFGFVLSARGHQSMDFDKAFEFINEAERQK